MKYSAAALTFFLLLSCRGWCDGWDYNAGGSARSMPWGASVNGELGYDVRLWGNPDQGFKYGFIRPQLDLSTSGFVNDGTVKVSIFPISLIGIEFGTEISQRHTTFQTADCTDDECEGVLRSQFIGTNLSFGYGPFFFQGHVQWIQFFPDQSTTPFVDDYSVIAGAAGGDTLFFRDELFGLKLAVDTSFGFYLAQSNMISQETSNFLTSAFVRHLIGPFSALVGLGTYSSSTQGTTATVFGVLQWTGAKSMEL